MSRYKAQRMAEPYIAERIFSFLPRSSKTAKILDIATGQGYILELLYEKGYRNLYATDVDENNFKLNKKTFHFKKLDADKDWPYRNGFFNIVISSETLEHVENPWHFFREAYRVLKPKGYLLLSTPSVEGIVSRVFFSLTGM